MNYFKAIVDTVLENIQPIPSKPQTFFEKQDSLELASPITSPSTSQDGIHPFNDSSNFYTNQGSRESSMRMSISLSQFNPLQTSTPKSVKTRFPKRSPKKFSINDISQKSIKSTKSTSSSASEGRSSGPITKSPIRRKFTKENKDEASDWLMELEKNDIQKLKKVLEEAGIDRKNFQKKIFNNETMKKVWKIKIREAIGGKKYSQALESILQGDLSLSDDGHRIDQQYVEAVMDEGGGVRFYNYMLIDSRLCRKDTTKVIFEEFIGAAFYIGKGADNRAVDHLKDALKFDNHNHHGSLKNHPKLSYINEIWREEGAVYVLRLFHDVHEDIAHLREEAMIIAFGLTNLTNDRHGHQFKRPRGYTHEMLPIHGAFLLHKAFHVFVNNLPPPIRRHNMLYVPDKIDFEVKKVNF